MLERSEWHMSVRKWESIEGSTGKIMLGDKEQQWKFSVERTDLPIFTGGKFIIIDSF